MSPARRDSLSLRPMSAADPSNREEVDAWVADANARHDPFAKVAHQTELHRLQHGCDAWHSGNASLLGALTAAAQPRRILEVGTALGYSALWLAHGSAPHGRVTTIEADVEHAEMARLRIADAGFSKRIDVVCGNAVEVLADTESPFDFIYYDAAVPTVAEFEHFTRLARTGATLVTSNLFLGVHGDMPGLEEGARYRELLVSDERWLTGWAGHKAISIRR